MDDVQLFGELDSWPSMHDMASILTRAGLTVTVGRYSICLNDFDHFVLQEYGGDLGDPQIEFEADTFSEMLRDAGRVSQVLADASLRHRFEIYDDAHELVGYLHHDWPQSPVA
ncbi:hypothetical protein Pla52o_34240 [Novipirellula galeiformis]|uniref:Uncharacterized protein n=1 Tax=Novipirellula galeiformis TaxID=2528004 RepID=A0A5C6CDN7_9BACT|nr:hypothetical protein [Novipirellula galeiformis]TWU22368.1 hypothetical protein Pla52o_34240 [Novipirellula galeiformis]